MLKWLWPYVQRGCQLSFHHAELTFQANFVDNSNIICIENIQKTTNERTSYLYAQSPRDQGFVSEYSLLLDLRKNGSIWALRSVNKPILSFRKSPKFSIGILTQLETSLKKIHKIPKLYLGPNYIFYKLLFLPFSFTFYVSVEDLIFYSSDHSSNS